MKYVWQGRSWPKLHWDTDAILPLLVTVSREQGSLIGRMQYLGIDQRSEAQLQTLTEDVVESSLIEGENLPREQVRSSIARKLHLRVKNLVRSDRNVDGIVELMTDATVNYGQPLTESRLFKWHSDLFPSRHRGLHEIAAGRWREGPIAVVSGAIGKERAHFEAPPSDRVPAEMATFLEWFEQPKTIDPLLAAGLAHFWFVTIHPFDDGNGRIARAIADMALCRAEKSIHRYYSMSAQIRNERDDYYDNLERSQKGGVDITLWQTWFLGCLLRAIEGADRNVQAVLTKARFWRRFAGASFNDRQRKVLNRLLDGFEGKLTSTKWARLTKSSQDTAHRDIVDLVEQGALTRDPGGGRSTSYSLATPE